MTNFYASQPTSTIVRRLRVNPTIHDWLRSWTCPWPSKICPSCEWPIRELTLGRRHFVHRWYRNVWFARVHKTTHRFALEKNKPHFTVDVDAEVLSFTGVDNDAIALRASFAIVKWVFLAFVQLPGTGYPPAANASQRGQTHKSSDPAKGRENNHIRGK